MFRLRRRAAFVKGCQMPALLRKTARRDRTGWAGVGQASREETAGYAAVDQNRGWTMEI